MSDPTGDRPAYAEPPRPVVYVVARVMAHGNLDLVDARVFLTEAAALAVAADVAAGGAYPRHRVTAYALPVGLPPGNPDALMGYLAMCGHTTPARALADRLMEDVEGEVAARYAGAAFAPRAELLAAVANFRLARGQSGAAFPPELAHAYRILLTTCGLPPDPMPPAVRAPNVRCPDCDNSGWVPIRDSPGGRRPCLTCLWPWYTPPTYVDEVDDAREPRED